MPSWILPSDSHSPGDTGHTSDHNHIVDDLSLIEAAAPVVAGGLAGATQATRWVGAFTTSPASGSGTWDEGDWGPDVTNGGFYVCTAGGTPGTWVHITASSGAVASVFGRTGAVAATSGDYTVSEVTGAAPLASPVFTGTPQAPTPSAGDDSTKLATTAYIDKHAGITDWLNAVTQYGADPTGSADSTTAIQDAIDALPGAGGVVYLPAGTYKISSTITLTDNQCLAGAGVGATVITSSTDTVLIQMGNEQSDHVMRNWMLLAGMTVNQTAGSQTHANVKIDGGGRGTSIQRVSADGGKYGFELMDLDRCDFYDISANNPGTAGIFLEVGYQNTYGTCTFVNCDAVLSGNSTYGFYVGANADQPSPNQPDRLAFIGCMMFMTGGLTGCVGFYDTIGMTSANFTACLFEQNKRQFRTDGSSSSVNFLGCTFLDSTDTATDIAYLNGSGTFTFRDCRFQQATNCFNGVSGSPSVSLEGRNNNQGNITSVWTGSFGYKGGTDTNFAGSGVLSLGSSGDPYSIISAGAFAAAGLTGATAASRYVGATASGAPASGTFAVGDFIIDQSGKVWVCTTAGTPGTWTQAGGGGGGSPGGSNTQLQYNSSGSFGGSGNLTYNGTTLYLESVDQSSGNNVFTIQDDFSNYLLNMRDNGTLAVGAASDPDNWAGFYVVNGFRCDDDFRFKKSSGAQYFTRIGGSGYDLQIQVPGNQLLFHGAGGMTFQQAVAMPLVSKSSAYTPGLDDCTILVSGTTTITLPSAANLSGQVYVIKNTGTGTVTVGTSSSQTVDGASSISLSSQNEAVTVQSDGSNWWVTGQVATSIL